MECYTSIHPLPVPEVLCTFHCQWSLSIPWCSASESGLLQNNDTAWICRVTRVMDCRVTAGGVPARAVSPAWRPSHTMPAKSCRAPACARVLKLRNGLVGPVPDHWHLRNGAELASRRRRCEAKSLGRTAKCSGVPSIERPGADRRGRRSGEIRTN